MPSPVVRDLITSGDAEVEREVRQANAVDSIKAQNQRFLEHIKDYERIKVLRERLAKKTARDVIKKTRDQKEREQLFDQMFAERSKEIEKSRGAVRRALVVGFDDGAWMPLDTVAPLPQQEELIKKNRPVKLTRSQVLARMVEEEDDVDRKIDILANRMDDEQKAKYQEIYNAEHHNPWNKSTGIARFFEVLGALGSGVRGADMGFRGYAREITSDVPVEAIPDEEREGTGIASLAKRAVGTHPLFSASSEVSHFWDGSGRSMGVPVTEAIKRIITDPDKIAEAASRTWEGAKAGFVDPASMRVENEAQQARILYTEAARQYIEKTMPHATAEEKDAAIEAEVEKHIERDTAGFSINNPNIAEVVRDIVYDPITYTGIGPVLKAAAKYSGARRGARALAATKTGQKVVKGVTESQPVIAMAMAKDKFTWMPSVQRMRRIERLGAQTAEEYADQMTRIERFADLSEAAPARAASYTRAVSEQAAPLMKAMRKVRSKEGQARVWRMLNEAPEQSAIDALSPVERRAYDAGKDLAPLLYAHMEKSGLAVQWRNIPVKTPLEDLPKSFVQNTTKAARPLMKAMSKLNRAERRKVWLMISRRAPPDKAAIDALSQAERAAYEAGTNISPSVMADMEKVGIPSRWHRGKGILSRIDPREHYAPSIIPVSGDVAEEGATIAERTASSKKARKRILASGSFRRSGETTPLEHAYKQFGAKIEEELPATFTAQAIRATMKAAEENKFLHHVPTNQADETLRALRESDPTMDWVAMDAPGDAATKMRTALQADKTPGLQDITQRLTRHEGMKRGSETILVPRDVRDLVESYAPLVPENQTLAEVGKALSRVIVPVSSFWRFAQTIPNYPFSVRNMISSVGLHSMSQGLGAISPKEMSATLGASFMAAFGNKAAREAMSKMTWTFPSGKKVSFGFILDQAEELGLINNLEMQLGEIVNTGAGRYHKNALDALLEAPAKGIKWAAEFGGSAKGKNPLYYVSPGVLAKATENYQHLMPFVSFLEGTAPEQVAKAFRLANRTSANYSQVGSFERGLMRHTLGFYGWNRFILPMMAKKLFTDTGRLTAWSKSMGGLKRWFGKDAPFSHKGEASWMNWGIPVTNLRDKYPEIGTHEYAVGIMENPLTFGYAFYPAFAKAFGMEVGGPVLHQILGPLAHAGIEIATGRDLLTGAELPSLYGMDELPSKVLQLLYSPVRRPAKQILDLKKLYMNDAYRFDKTLDLELRYAVGRITLGLDNILLESMGMEGRSMGGMLDLAYFREGGTGVFGHFQYPVNAYHQASRKHRDASGGRLPALISRRRHQ